MGNSESSVEKYLNYKVEQLGGTTRKYISPGRVGVADRLCFFPGGRLFFVEVKTDEGMETGMQCRERIRMLKLGQKAVIIYGKSGVDRWLSSMFSLLVLFCFLGVAHADSEQWRKDLATFPVATPLARMNIAEGLLKDMKRLKAHFPVPTWSQIKRAERLLNLVGRSQNKSKWLQDMSDNAQFLEYLNSTEYSIYVLHSTFMVMIDTLHFMTIAKPDRTEPIAWLHFVSQMMVLETAMNNQMHRLVSKNIIELSEATKKRLRLGGGASSLWGPYSKTARLIVVNVIAPLMFEIKEQ